MRRLLPVRASTPAGGPVTSLRFSHAAIQRSGLARDCSPWMPTGMPRAMPETIGDAVSLQ